MKPAVKAALAIFALALVVPVLGVAAPDASAAVRQRGSTTLLPQIVQPGAKVASANRARLVGTVKFRPVRKGRPVLIQRRVGRGSWHKVARKRENGAGVVSFTGPARNARGRWYTYRGVALRWNGLRKVAAKPQSAAVWNQKFTDEFKGTSLSSKWSHRSLGTYSAASDRACSASAKDAVKVGGGRVSLLVKGDRAKDRSGPCVAKDADGQTYSNTHWYKNGQISTQGSDNGSFRYGVTAARVKFDRAMGAHGSFWMQSAVPFVDGRGPARNGAEVDVVEYFGRDFKRGDIYSFIHYTSPDGKSHKVPNGTPVRAARRALRGDDDWFKKYHVFSVQWTPRSYVFRVDGIQTLKVRAGVSKVPEYLILSMLSSGWELEKLKRGTLPNATQVDWVRVWQK